ncbi:MAG: dihydrofolate reductase family protein [Microthrixaceae bacterium]
MLEASGPPLDPRRALEQLVAPRGSHPEGRAWVSTDMVMSMDGAYSLEGRSAGLSSEADHALFIAHRHAADAILVGAATVRAERYRRPRVDEATARMRTERGQRRSPLLVVTSSSLHLGDDVPLLVGDPPPPLLVHPASSDVSAAPLGVELLAAGQDSVDLGLMLQALFERGVRTVACEGGPALLGQLAAADLIDEYLVTLAPRLVGGEKVGLLGSTPTPPRDFGLGAVVRDGDHIMCSYRRLSPRRAR